jgi:alkylation response protein AidB-like acyl-CoA dehydrogenase
VLNDSGFSAVHVPEAYGGQGADSVAACMVIEEVARVCGSSSLIPGVNKLGTIGLIVHGSEELKKQVLPTLASGDAMASYALSEREAGSDPASMRTAPAPTATTGCSTAPSVGSLTAAGQPGTPSWHQPRQGAKGISAFIVHKDDPGFTVGSAERNMGIKGSPTTELYFQDAGFRAIGLSVSREPA